MENSKTKLADNAIYSVARIDAVKFQYEIAITTDNKDHATAILNDYRNAGEPSFMMREFKEIGLSIEEQLKSKNDGLKDIQLKCEKINECRKAAKKAQKLLTAWYVENKENIKRKESGELFSVWDKSIKSVISKISTNPDIQIWYEWDYSLCIKIKGSTQLSNGVTNYFNEYVYICDSDGSLCKPEYQSDFKTVAPMRYFKAQSEISAIDDKIKALQEKQTKLKNLLAV